MSDILDAPTLRVGIERLLRDDALRAQIGMTAQLEARTCFDASVMWAEVAKVLDRLAGDRATTNSSRSERNGRLKPTRPTVQGLGHRRS